MRDAVPYVIAEIASAHEGDPALAQSLFRMASMTGADGVKFQMFCRDTLLSRRHPKFPSFGEIEIGADQWRAILAKAAESDVDVLVEVFDEASLDLAEAGGCVKGYKIPTSDIGNPDFIARVGATGKPVMLGVGGALLDEVEAAVAVLRRVNAGRVVLMHGFQAYPTRVEDTNLAKLSALADRFGLEVGYADHVDATDAEAARVVPLMAVAAGCTVIEKHITDCRARLGRDRFSALNPDEFAGFVTLVRRMAPAIGTAEDRLTEAEKTYRDQMKRQAVAARALAAGTPLAAADVLFKRTNRSGLGQLEIRNLAGRPLARALEADEPILPEDFA